MLKLYRNLKKKGVLNINQRNSDYILKYNPRKFFPLVDDKLKTKNLALAAGIPVPLLYDSISSEQQILNTDLAKYKDFVIKPAHGSGGEGIIVITNAVNDFYRQINGKLLTKEDLNYHFSSILAGIYSLGGHADYALIEQRVIVDKTFEEISFTGIPDLRIIVLLGYPAMAMVRLPTSLSQGKANLHQGAIGVGINIASGTTEGGVFQNKAIDVHPDTLEPIANISIPYWHEILNIAARCFELTGLGYLGVDLVLDKEHGPQMLEINARPGLNIQIANMKGGLKIYQQIEDYVSKLDYKENVNDRICFSKALYSHLGSYTQ